MKVWLLSDYDNRKHQAFRGLIYRSTSGASGDIKIEVKSRTNLWRSLFAHLRDARNNPLPDVLELPLNWTRRFASLGVLADLKPHVRYLAEKAYLPAVMAELCRHGDSAIYSVPWWQKSPALYYREKVLKDFCSDPAAGLSTWKGFRRILDRLAETSRFHNHRLISIPGSSLTRDNVLVSIINQAFINEVMISSRNWFFSSFMFSPSKAALMYRLQALHIQYRHRRN